MLCAAAVLAACSAAHAAHATLAVSPSQQAPLAASRELLVLDKSKRQLRVLAFGDSLTGERHLRRITSRHTEERSYIRLRTCQHTAHVTTTEGWIQTRWTKIPYTWRLEALLKQRLGGGWRVDVVNGGPQNTLLQPLNLWSLYGCHCLGAVRVQTSQSEGQIDDRFAPCMQASAARACSTR